MEQAALLWLVVLVVLVALFLLALRRMSVLVARTRTWSDTRRLTRQLADRLAATARPVRHAARRDRGAAAATRAASRRRSPRRPGRAARDRGRGSRGQVPRGLAREAAAFTVELDRAVRAAELVGHGLDALVGGPRRPRPRGPDVAQARRAQPAARDRRPRRGSSREIAAVRPGDMPPAADRRTRCGRRCPRYIVDGDLDDRS